MADRVNIYIDGGNFYHLVIKKLGIPEVEFDFDGFAKYLANGRVIIDMGKRYYVGTVRERVGDAHSKLKMSAQTSLFSQLIKNKWEVKTSKLRERKERLMIDSRVEEYDKLIKLGIQEIKYSKNREKGIDVKLVTDLFIGAIDNRYDTAVIVSSDTDLVPAFDALRHRLKRKIEYVGFSLVDRNNPEDKTTPIISLIKKSDIQRTLVESDLKPFIIPKLFNK